MKVHLRQIPAEGLRFEGEEDCPISDLAPEEVVCAGPLRYALDVGITDNALWASGTLEQPVTQKCVACLEAFEHTISVPGFALHTELGGPETIDLGPFVREDILLNLPAYPHCDREGNRVCPARAILDAPKEGDAQLKEAPPDWSALDKLKL